jgi:hypothetical protein
MGDDVAECRICLQGGGELVSPCRCSGSQGRVHRWCLDQWRAADVRPDAMTTCSECRFRYKLHEVGGPADLAARKATYNRLVARDTALFVLAVLAAMAATVAAVFVGDNYAASGSPLRHQVFPASWSPAAVYSVAGLFAFFFVVGMVGLVSRIAERCCRTGHAEDEAAELLAPAPSGAAGNPRPVPATYTIPVAEAVPVGGFQSAPPQPEPYLGHHQQPFQQQGYQQQPWYGAPPQQAVPVRGAYASVPVGDPFLPGAQAPLYAPQGYYASHSRPPPPYVGRQYHYQSRTCCDIICEGCLQGCCQGCADVACQICCRGCIEDSAACCGSVCANCRLNQCEACCDPSCCHHAASAAASAGSSAGSGSGARGGSSSGGSSSGDNDGCKDLCFWMMVAAAILVAIVGVCCFFLFAIDWLEKVRKRHNHLLEKRLLTDHYVVCDATCEAPHRHVDGQHLEWFSDFKPARKPVAL